MTSSSRADLVAALGEGVLAQHLQLAVGGRPFPVVDRRAQGELVGHHDRVGPEAAQLGPVDELGVPPLADDEGRDPALHGVDQEVADRSELLGVGPADQLAPGRLPEGIAHASPSRARKSSTAAPRPTRSSRTNSSVTSGTTRAAPDTASWAGRGM